MSFLFWLSVMPYVVVEHMEKCHGWISRLDLINPITLLDLISYILWFGLISSIIWFDLLKFFIIMFNYFDSNCYSPHLPMEGGERCSQNNYG